MTKINSDNAEKNIGGLEQLGQSSTPKSKTVVPTPGFCLKTKTDLDEKIFINICKGDDLPKVRDISDAELLKLIEEEDPSGFRIPLSLGEPHVEVDKNGKGCTAYDVVVNTEFFERLQHSGVLMGFLTTVVLEGIEYKYNKSLSRNWVILKNRKYVGSMPDHHIRTESKPWIMEMDEVSQIKHTPPPKWCILAVVSRSSTNKTNLITEFSQPKKEETKKGPEPPYTILQEPAEGHPEFIVAEMHLPKVKNVLSMTLDVGEDRILLQTRSNVYHLDIYLPYNIIQEECGSQFDKSSKTLTLTMPVQLPS